MRINLGKFRAYMKRIWFISAILLLVFEWLRVYFVMPMPGSQQWNTLDFAFTLHQYRWVIRVLIIVPILWCLKVAWQGSWKSCVVLLFLNVISIYLTNFPLSADSMFLSMGIAKWVPAGQNKIAENRLVIGLVYHGIPRAYPINILAHHHQVVDTLDKQFPILVTYCSVCRTAMVYQHPNKNGALEKLRLVGMDHFNAMFEDEATGSWWQQATGEAVAGPRKGEAWATISYTQTTLAQWIRWYPNSLILQEDPAFVKQYQRLEAFDDGSIESDLLHRSKDLNHSKNWVAWVKVDGQNRMYSWENLEASKWLVDSFNGKRWVVATMDNKSVFAYFLPEDLDKKSLNLSLIIENYPTSEPLEVHQEFLHSYRQFRK